MKHRRSPFFPALIFLLGSICVVIAATLVEDAFLPKKPLTFGVTFIPSYAVYLGVDPQKTLNALLSDMHVKLFRLSVPWDRVEPNQDQFTWNEIDWQLAALEKNNATAIVAIGRRSPRWPECHDPSWIQGLHTADQESAVLSMLEQTVTHLKNQTTIIAWQVENEPLLSLFGACGMHSVSSVKKEIALVRSLDPSRPILTTDSGELSTWFREAPLVNALGISIYRQTWNAYLGKIIYPLTASMYRRHAELTEALTGTPIFVSELQAEPWAKKSLTETPIDEQLQIFNEKNLNDNIAFAQKVGLSPVYLWGAEWWYWLKQNDHPELWKAAKKVFETK